MDEKLKRDADAKLRDIIAERDADATPNDLVRPDRAAQRQAFENTHTVVQNYVCNHLLDELRAAIEDKLKTQDMIDALRVLKGKEKVAKYEELKIAVFSLVIASVHALALLHLLICVETNSSTLLVRRQAETASSLDDEGRAALSAALEEDVLRTARRFLTHPHGLPALLRATTESTTGHMGTKAWKVTAKCDPKTICDSMLEIFNAVSDELWGAPSAEPGVGRPLESRMTRYLLAAFELGEAKEGEEAAEEKVCAEVHKLREQSMQILRGDLTDDVLGVTTRAARSVMVRYIRDNWPEGQDRIFKAMNPMRQAVATSGVWGKSSNTYIEAMKQSEDLEVMCIAIYFAEEE